MAENKSDLAMIRRVHALRVGGMSLRKIASETGVSHTTVATLLADYHHHRKAGTLFGDLPKFEDDMYAHPALRVRNGRAHP